MKSRCWVGLMVLTGLVGGCTDDYWPLIDQKPQTGNVSTETSVPKTVDLSVAKAWYWNNEITVMGWAQPSALAGKDTLGGFIDVEVLDKNNNVVETAMASLTPGTLSSSEPSQYKISIWAQHPCDNHLKLVFIDQRDEAAYLGRVGGLGDDAGGGGKGANSGSFSGNYSRGGGGSSYGFGNFGRGVSGVGGLNGVSTGGYSNGGGGR